LPAGWRGDERGGDVRQEEIVVLEIAEGNEVEANARGQHDLSLTTRHAREHLTGGERVRGNEQHQKAETPVPDGVEEVARDYQ
jgi:hypothetical protein